MRVKEESEKAGLEYNIQKMKIMASGPITSWQIDGETVKTVTNFIFLGSKITADGDWSHEIKRRLLLVRKAMTNLDSILKSRDITLPTKVCLVKAMVFLVVMCGCGSWTIKKAERQRIDAFELKKVSSFYCCYLLTKSCLSLCNSMNYRPPGYPRDFVHENTGVGCQFLLQGIFLTQELNLSLLHCRQILLSLSHQRSPFFLLFLTYLSFLVSPHSMWDLSALTLEPLPPVVEAQSFNPRTAGEGPLFTYFYHPYF